MVMAVVQTPGIEDIVVLLEEMVAVGQAGIGNVLTQR